jgi:hypothetical protein
VLLVRAADAGAGLEVLRLGAAADEASRAIDGPGRDGPSDG